MAIELTAVRKSYRRPDGSKVVVLDVDQLSVADGEEVCVVGGSGTGKTTLLNVVAGIVIPDSGQVRVCGTDLPTLSEAARDRFRARHVGYLFQVFNLLQALSALENVALPLTFAGVSIAEARRTSRKLLERVGLGSKVDQRPAALSVGEQQRVALARAVACSPKLLLADEPTASLDPANAAGAMALLREVVREHGAALVVVTHDERVRAAFKRVVELRSAA